MPVWLKSFEDVFVGVPYLFDLYLLLGVGIFSWFSGVVIEFAKGPALIGELIGGIIVGPFALDVLPDASVQVLSLLGQIGLLLLVFEGGLSMDVEVLAKVGVRAFVLAFTGTAVPVLLGWGVMAALGFPRLEAVACGTALSSTAIGFTIKLMQDAGMVSTSLGQLITAAAMIDDVFSLVVLAVLQQLSFGTVDFWPVFRPIVASIGVYGVGVVYRILLNKCFSLISWPAGPAYTRLLLCTMTVSALGFTLGADHFYSTHLLGVFMAGMSFSPVRGAEEVWTSNVAQIQGWLVRLFFAASMGFLIPVDALFNTNNLYNGLILTLAAIIGKLCTGVWAGPVRAPGFAVQSLQVGCAMIGRGELGFVLAASSLTSGLMTEESFSATIWALVLATIIGPFAFRASMLLRVVGTVSDQGDVTAYVVDNVDDGSISSIDISVPSDTQQQSHIPNKVLPISNQQPAKREIPMSMMEPPIGFSNAVTATDIVPINTPVVASAWDSVTVVCVDDRGSQQRQQAPMSLPHLARMQRDPPPPRQFDAFSPWSVRAE